MRKSLKHTMKRALKLIKDKGPCYYVDHRIRSKRTYELIRIQRSTLMELLTRGYVSVDETLLITITQSGVDIMKDGRTRAPEGFRRVSGLVRVEDIDEFRRVTKWLMQ